MIIKILCKIKEYYHKQRIIIISYKVPKSGGIYMIKNSIDDIYIVIGLLVFAIPMVLDSNKDTVSLGKFLLICAAFVVIVIIYNMILYYIKENYYRKPSNVNAQKKIEAILNRKYLNEDGTYSFEELKKMKK